MDGNIYQGVGYIVVLEDNSLKNYRGESALDFLKYKSINVERQPKPGRVTVRPLR